MGLGHFGGGLSAARWLARQGAVVTVTDQADENALADSLPLLAGVPIAAIHLGGHREEHFRGADLIVVNPAVRPDSPWLQFARSTGARLCTELELFMENCPARIIGVTGSNGKSTTAAMIASILSVSGRRVFLGGNIGGSLLDDLPQMTPDDWVVLEISSFQLWHLASRAPHAPREGASCSPHTPCADSPSARGDTTMMGWQLNCHPIISVCRLQGAVITGCSPNHLDWHPTYADYVASKQRIFTLQTPDDFAVLNMSDAEAASWLPLVRGRAIGVSRDGIRHTLRAEAGSAHGVCGLRGADSAHEVCGLQVDDLPALAVPGEHNRLNAACAAAAALAAGCDRDDVCRGLAAFRGLPQRLEHIATVDGCEFYNDSAATTPESTIAALQSFDVPLWLLAGGKGKGGDFQPLAAEIARRARGAAFFGSLRHELSDRVASADAAFLCTTVETLEEALDWCWRQSRPGDAVVLSPGCASTDQFRNFRQRGERFTALVQQLAGLCNR
jgi:UDP-N-acetylmuramoylalanine--D-glutamate ligase